MHSERESLGVAAAERPGFSYGVIQFSPSKSFFETLISLVSEVGLSGYIDPDSQRLREPMAEILGVEQRCLRVGPGADYWVDLFLRSARSKVWNLPRYSYPGYTQRLQKNAIQAYDRLADVEAVSGAGTVAIYPGNPVSTCSLSELIESLAGHEKMLVDCTYLSVFDAMFPVIAANALKHGHAVVGSFSKIHGLAGLRAGFMVRDFDSEPLSAAGLRFPLDPLQTAFWVALEENEIQVEMRRHVERVQANNASLTSALRGLGYRVFDSDLQTGTCVQAASIHELRYLATRLQGRGYAGSLYFRADATVHNLNALSCFNEERMT